MTRLADKAKAIDLNLDDDESPPTSQREPVPEIAKREAAPPQARSRTGIGMVAHAMSSERQLRVENASLREQVKQLESNGQVMRLDPQSVKASTYANRHESAFATSAFETLKQEILEAGGNIQPIKVRPTAPGEFELVFGHRRHRACLELGLPVLAMIEPLDDRELFVQMERENREREDLSAWEQGTMYQRALNLGLFPSLRQLAATIGISHSNVVKAIATAQLPRAVVEAFTSPLEIQFRWAALLKDALERDSLGVLERAKALSQSHSPRDPKHVLNTLLGMSGRKDSATVLESNGKTIGEFRQGKGGAVHVKFRPGSLTTTQLESLRRFVQDLAK